MTEAEWRSCPEPGPMLDFLRGRADDRKLRLFACACCRGIHHLVPAGPCRAAVEVALRYADGRTTAEELAAARAAAVAAAGRAGPDAAAVWAAAEAANPSAVRAARAAAEEAREQVRRVNPRAAAEEAEAQAGFLRDIIGDPFAPVPGAPLRRRAADRRVRDAALAMYAGGPAEDARLLADELVRAGCDHEGVLTHLRGPGPHVRGCWVVDLLLGHDPGAEEPATRPGVVGLPPEEVEEGAAGLRNALAEFLGPSRYARFLRRVLNARGEGLPREWEEFAAAHPAYAVPEAAVVEACRVCWVHGCALAERRVAGPPDSERDPGFLRARGTRFPYSHPHPAGAEAGGAERVIWWCPECQQARAAWEAEQRGEAPRIGTPGRAGGGAGRAPDAGDREGHPGPGAYTVWHLGPGTSGLATVRTCPTLPEAEARAAEFLRSSPGTVYITSPDDRVVWRGRAGAEPADAGGEGRVDSPGLPSTPSGVVVASARDVLARVAAAYAGLRTYRDAGVRVTADPHRGAGGHFVTRVLFRTAFARPDRLKVESWTPTGVGGYHRFLLVARGDTARTYWEVNGREEERELARATGFATIACRGGGTPRLDASGVLLPAAFPPPPGRGRAPGDQGRLADGQVGGVACARVGRGIIPARRGPDAAFWPEVFRLGGGGADPPPGADAGTVVWVEQRTFLIRRVEDLSRPSGVSVTTYFPEADVPLGDDDFAFDPGPGVGPPEALLRAAES